MELKLKSPNPFKGVSLLGALLPVLSSCDFQAGDRPNVILIITDDQGYGDISATGNPYIHTPNLDSLINESAFFSNYHVDPTCSPSRAALLTGKYAHRVNVWHTVMGGNFLPAEEVTLAEAFKAVGYNTALFGKWHLGGNYPFRPIDQGYDTWVGQGDGGTGAATDYWFNDRVDDHYIINNRWEHLEGYGTDVFFNRAIEYLKEVDQAAPFFIHLATYIPHNPVTIPDTSWIQDLKEKVPLQTAYYYAGIERVDYNLGRLRKQLEESELSHNTILLYMSDNGGTYGIEIFNAGMRSGKGSPYDGGHRVPLVLHWPGGGLDNYQEINSLTAHVDIFPTMLELCNVELNKPIDFDGQSLVKLLKGKSEGWPDRKLVVEVQRQTDPVKYYNSAVMSEDWRLVNGVELYHIKKDPGQQNDVSSKYPAITNEMKKHFDVYWQSMKEEEKYAKSPVLGENGITEIALCSEEWIPLNDELPPWNQYHVSMGMKKEGYWTFRTVKDGTYSIIVSRWPLESGLPFNQAALPRQSPDAYHFGSLLLYSIYNTHNQEFSPLKVHAVRVRTGESEKQKVIGHDDKLVSFDFTLEKGMHTIKADLLDNRGEVITSAYYIKIKEL